MNLGEAKRQTLVLMREWTLEGREIPAAENADYLRSAEDLANVALMDIARLKKIPAMAKLENALDVQYGYFVPHALPSDYMETDRVVYFEDGFKVNDPFWLYEWIDQKTIGLHKDATGEFMLHYYRLPELFTPDPNDVNANNDKEFDVAAETHYLIPFFMAAQLFTDEDRGLAQVKLNEYHTRLAGLSTPNVMRTDTVQNVLGW